MSGENKFAKQVKDGINSTDVPTHISFIESHASANGIPDMNIAIRDVQVFIELKCELEINKLPKVRASQVRWFKNRAATGAKNFLFAKLKDEEGILYLLISGEYVYLLPRAKTIREWIYLSHSYVRGEINWYDFVCGIGGEYNEED